MHIAAIFSFIFPLAHCYCQHEPLESNSLSLKQRVSDQLRVFVPSRYMYRVFKSKLPVFIRDIDHHWIKDACNLAWLERRRDPVCDLCHVAEGGNKVPGERATPSNIFDRLDIDNNSWEILSRTVDVDRNGWVNMQDRLTEMSKCPAALQRVKYLYIDLYNPNGDIYPDFGAKVIELMADVLPSMANLQHIRWGHAI